MPGSPQRVVSLDYCADQYVLRFVPRTRILALSPHAEASYTPMRTAAAGLPKVRPRAEDVLVLKPDLVVRSYGGGPRIGALLARAGVPVVQLGFPASLAQVRAMVLETASALGAPEEGQTAVAAMDAALNNVMISEQKMTALYMTPAGVTAGPGTLVHDIIGAAGLRGLETRPGWHTLPLEDLAYETPDLVVVADFGQEGSHMSSWTAMAHPVAQRQLRERPAVRLNGGLTSCGGWFATDAVTQLAAAQETRAP